MNRILPALDAAGNQTLLSEWLQSETEYVVVDPEPERPFSTPFDLCIVDAPTLANHRERLIDRRKDAHPEFLPVLLLVPRQYADQLSEEVWDAVDDIIWTSGGERFDSLDTFELRGRLQSLLRMRSMSETLDRRATLISVLSRILRHNLRNDMTVVRGRVAMLEERFDDVAEISDPVLDTVDDLIELSETARKFESIVNRDMDHTPTDLVTLVQAVQSDLQAEYPSASFTVEGPETLSITAKPSLRIALEELLENAVKHTRDTEPEVTVAIDPHSDDIQLDVIDNGPGLPDQEQEILDEGTETSLVHGSGLGLWMVYWIVTDHGGTIDTAVSDEGTRVTVALPHNSTMGDSRKQTPSGTSPRSPCPLGKSARNRRGYRPSPTA